MKFIEFLRVAFASILENSMRSFLTMLGIIIGVGLIILLVSMTAGFREYLVGQFMGIGTNLIIVSPGKTETKGMGHPGMEGVQKMTRSDSMAIRKNAYAVEETSSVIIGTADVRY